jgi:hypothetical protein
MEVATRPIGQTVFKAMKFEFECANEFKYLGISIANSNRITAEINHRTGIANRCYHGSKDMLKSR